MEKTKKNNVSKIFNVICNIFLVLFVLFFVWFCWSIVDVVLNNISCPQSISQYNIFSLAIKYWVYR